MSVPASYTAEELADYLAAVLGKTATVLGWTSDSYDEAINDALLLYGVDAIGDATNIGKLRACARLALWQAVEADTVGYHDFSEDQQTFRLHQVHQQATAQLKQARKEAARYGIGGLAMSSVAMTRTSPFDVTSDTDGSA